MTFRRWRLELSWVYMMSWVGRVVMEGQNPAYLPPWLPSLSSVDSSFTVHVIYHVPHRSDSCVSAFHPHHLGQTLVP